MLVKKTFLRFKALLDNSDTGMWIVKDISILQAVTFPWRTQKQA
jgi:hypothetical protein